MSTNRQAVIRQHGEPAGRLMEIGQGGWRFTYEAGYAGPPVSLALPVRAEPYDFAGFPPFLEGLLPEGRSWRRSCGNTRLTAAIASGS